MGLGSLPPGVGSFAAFRMAYVALGWLGAWAVWRRPRPAAAVALMVLAVLGLASFSLSQHTPVPPLWAANFLLKPNHAMGWGVCGVLLGMRMRRSRPWALGLGLGLLAWAYFMGWPYLSAGLVMGT